MSYHENEEEDCRSYKDCASRLQEIAEFEAHRAVASALWVTAEGTPST